jgi:hypothetical protein
MRVGVMYYRRANRDQLGTRNILKPTDAYTPVTFTTTNGPNGPQQVTVYNISAEANRVSRQIRDNRPELDTDYKGVELTASKRFSSNWQMVGGLTLGRNRGGQGGADLNDPNLRIFPDAIIGNDSKVGFRLSGSYRLPWDFNFAGSLVSNTGYPFVSTFNLTQAAARNLGISLTRSSQTIDLTERGEERLPNVTLADFRISRTFRFGNRRIIPQLDVFNISNADTVVSLQSAVGGTYLNPREILSPRIIRVGFSLDF